MATTFGSIKSTGTAAFAGAVTMAVSLALAGNLALGGNDITGVANITFTGTQSGAQLDVTPTTGTAGLVMFGGAKGSHICMFDTDAAAWSAYDSLNGTLTGRIASAGECP